MKPFKQGDIVLARFDFTETGGSKQRPALIISNSNQDENYYESVILAYITTTDFEDGFSKEIKPEHLTQPLKTRCYLRLVKLHTAEEAQLGSVITRLKPEARNKMIGAIVELLKPES